MSLTSDLPPSRARPMNDSTPSGAPPLSIGRHQLARHPGDAGGGGYGHRGAGVLDQVARLRAPGPTARAMLAGARVRLRRAVQAFLSRDAYGPSGLEGDGGEGSEHRPSESAT